MLTLKADEECTACILHGIFPFLPWPADKDRTSGQRGWKEFVVQVNEVRKEINPPLNFPMVANSYQIASMLAFYLPDQPRTHSLNLYVRSNHYELLPERTKILNDTILFVAEFYQGKFPVDYLAAFRNYILKPEIEIGRQDIHFKSCPG